MGLRRNHVILILKLLVVGIAFSWVLAKADTEELALYVLSVDPMVLVFAFVFLMVSQVVSAFRMQYYFRLGGLDLPSWYAVRLYFVGMFLNTILPGGIGGDGYKIYLVGKQADFPEMKALRLLLSDRANGLFVLLVLSFVLVMWLEILSWILLVAAWLLLIVGYFVSIKIMLQESWRSAYGALGYSFFVQIFSVLVVVSILFGWGVDLADVDRFLGYVLLFLVSSVVAVLPVSVGGVGIRELSFMYGAEFIGLDIEMGVAIAMVYFVVNLFCSLNGLFFWRKLKLD